MDEKRLLRIKSIGEIQEYYFKYIRGHKVGMIGFFSDDWIYIINPFKSENLKENVDPIDYYGEIFLNSDFLSIL